MALSKRNGFVGEKLSVSQMDVGVKNDSKNRKIYKLKYNLQCKFYMGVFQNSYKMLYK